MQKSMQAWFVRTYINVRANSASGLAPVQTRLMLNALHVTVNGVSFSVAGVASMVMVVAVVAVVVVVVVEV